ncbi:putative K+ channel tetramerization subfamily protein [Paratrimastix pyriformis]|uniref:K+ channel tetramerization subfamily protein n=1 Tax=Paratrimastix pyriformis TaxID=342808 RepID=A0ABQ8UL55_9EUKA|nr:putative K+ channel tetramerization subfamily protein [Paratrimastix pyriformis]
MSPAAGPSGLAHPRPERRFLAPGRPGRAGLALGPFPAWRFRVVSDIFAASVWTQLCLRIGLRRSLSPRFTAMSQLATAAAAAATAAEVADPLADFHESMETMLATISGSQERLLAKKKEISDVLQKREEAFHAQVTRFEKLQRECEKRFDLPENIITMNVGGRMFTTYKKVLLTQEDSMLAAMFSGRHPLSKGPDGVPFIDRNPKIFEKILDYLRTGHPPRWWAHPEERNDFLEDLTYFGLTLIQPTVATVIMTPEECEKLVEFTGAKSIILLYRGTRDGFQAATFHRLCDGCPRTVTVIQTTGGHVLGGYAAASWNQTSDDFCDDRQAFLFSLRGIAMSPIKIPNKLATKSGICCTPGYGPTWGGGYDLHVANGCNTNSSSSTNLGRSYASPDGTPYFLTGGSQYFQVAELEVFACTM